MTQHYFTENPLLPHHEKTIKFEAYGKELSFITDAGVFSKKGLDAGARLLIDALGPVNGIMLDVGCGWGPVGISVASTGYQVAVVMTDVNQRAVDLARRNVKLNKLLNVMVGCGDGFENIKGTFDVVAMNPPIRAGKTTVYSLFSQSRNFVSPGGMFIIVIRKRQGAESAQRYLETIYGKVEAVNKSGGYWVIKCQDPLPGAPEKP